MAKKIKISTVSKKFKEFLSILEDDHFKKIKWEEPSRNNSSDSFSHANALVLEELLPIIIIIATSYYMLDSAHDTLSTKVVKQIDNLKSNITQIFWNEQTTKSERDFFRKILKFYELSHTKQSFFKTKHVQSDSTSEQHNKVLKRDNKNQIRKNLILKIIGSGSEATKIRIGVITSETDKIIKLELVDILDKRNMG